MQFPWIEVSRSESRSVVEEHALVLEALGIPAAVAPVVGGHALLVPEADADRGREELARYVRENPGTKLRAEVAPPLWQSVAAALVYAGVLVLVDIAQRRELLGLDWAGRGGADATLIRQGAWWRSLTALCLHGDSVHLAGNLAFGALFGVMLAQGVGFGFAWISFVITGALGNELNAWLQAPSHASIGASTGVFGMLGVQVAFDATRQWPVRERGFRRWAPIVIGAALLAWLGGGPHIDPSDLTRRLDDLNVAIPKIDVWAHVLGFASGLGLGALFGWLPPSIRSTAGSQAALAVIAIAAVAIAWFLALR